MLHVIIVGAHSTGKTVLLRKLTGSGESDTLSKTIPTIGIHVEEIRQNPSSKKSPVIRLTELGGELAPLWTNYLQKPEQPPNLIFLVDVSRPSRFADAGVHLVNCLQALDGSRAKALIVYSKVDLPGERSLAEIRSLLRVNYLRAWFKFEIEEIEYCAWDNRGFSFIRSWLANLK